MIVETGAWRHGFCRASVSLISKMLVMTGGPGVDKATIAKGILRILATKGMRLLLCAPAITRSRAGASPL
jgi:ATP-dependent exoDNAse (exonuclease V) alpha subunit